MAKTIMIVDDSASVRQVVGIALRGAPAMKSSKAATARMR